MGPETKVENLWRIPAIDAVRSSPASYLRGRFDRNEAQGCEFIERHSNIRQNLFFAFIYNSLGVHVVAGVLYPWLRVLLSSMIAAAISFSPVLVVLNALRLKRVGL